MSFDGENYFYVVYYRPLDYPDVNFVVRRFVMCQHCRGPHPLLGSLLCDTIESARELIPSGHVRVKRSPQDGAQIVESWI